MSLKALIKMEKESRDIFFAEVKEPEEVRRNILESLKEIVESLQRFEKFKETRKDKLHNINKLGKIVKNTNKLVLDLKKSFPETKIRTMKAISKTAEKKKIGIRKKKEVAERKPLTELQKLESELSEIEGNLESLR